MFGRKKRIKMPKSEGVRLLEERRFGEGVRALEEELPHAKTDYHRYGLMYAYAEAAYNMLGAGGLAYSHACGAIELHHRMVVEQRIEPQVSVLSKLYHIKIELSPGYEDYFGALHELKTLFQDSVYPDAMNWQGIIRDMQKAGDPFGDAQIWLTLQYMPGIARGRHLNSVNAHSRAACIMERMMGLPSAPALARLAPIEYTANVLRLVDSYFLEYRGAVDSKATEDVICENALRTLQANGGQDGPALAELVRTRRGGGHVNIGQGIVKYSHYSVTERANELKRAQEGALYDTALALCGLEEGIPIHPADELFVRYNRVQCHWSMLGTGSEAAGELDALWQCWEERRFSSRDRENLRPTAANAAENAMLLCRAADEFIIWRERLRGLNPDAPILSDIGTKFIMDFESGTPWYETLMAVAQSNYDREDPADDAGRYANGAATWQLMLENRKHLRLPREAWKRAALEYGILVLRIVAQDARRLGIFYKEAEGYAPLRAALPYIEEYTAENPGDEVETEVLADIRKLI